MLRKAFGWEEASFCFGEAGGEGRGEEAAPEVFQIDTPPQRPSTLAPEDNGTNGNVEDGNRWDVFEASIFPPSVCRHL